MVLHEGALPACYCCNSIRHLAKTANLEQPNVATAERLATSRRHVAARARHRPGAQREAMKSQQLRVHQVTDHNSDEDIFQLSQLQIAPVCVNVN